MTSLLKFGGSIRWASKEIAKAAAHRVLPRTPGVETSRAAAASTRTRRSAYKYLNHKRRTTAGTSSATQRGVRGGVVAGTHHASPLPPDKGRRGYPWGLYALCVRTHDLDGPRLVGWPTSANVGHTSRASKASRLSRRRRLATALHPLAAHGQGPPYPAPVPGVAQEPEASPTAEILARGLPRDVASCTSQSSRHVARARTATGGLPRSRPKDYSQRRQGHADRKSAAARARSGAGRGEGRLRQVQGRDKSAGDGTSKGRSGADAGGASATRDAYFIPGYQASEYVARVDRLLGQKAQAMHSESQRPSDRRALPRRRRRNCGHNSPTTR